MEPPPPGGVGKQGPGPIPTDRTLSSYLVIAAPVFFPLTLRSPPPLSRTALLLGAGPPVASEEVLAKLRAQHQDELGRGPLPRSFSLV